MNKTIYLEPEEVQIERCETAGRFSIEAKASEEEYHELIYERIGAEEIVKHFSTEELLSEMDIEEVRRVLEDEYGLLTKWEDEQ